MRDALVPVILRSMWWSWALVVWVVGSALLGVLLGLMARGNVSEPATAESPRPTPEASNGGEVEQAEAVA